MANISDSVAIRRTLSIIYWCFANKSTRDWKRYTGQQQTLRLLKITDYETHPTLDSFGSSFVGWFFLWLSLDYVRNPAASLLTGQIHQMHCVNITFDVLFCEKRWFSPATLLIFPLTFSAQKSVPEYQFVMVVARCYCSAWILSNNSRIQLSAKLHGVLFFCKHHLSCYTLAGLLF